MTKKTFLREFCESLLESCGKEGLKDVTIVIPSERVALYVRENLLELVQGDFWMPRIVPINKFLADLHDFVQVDELELVFELYESYREVFESPESLDEFLSWSSMIVSDFNDVDKYLLDAKQVFRNLQSIKEIESWSFNDEELSETQKSFLKFWEQLGELYTNFQDRLAKRGEITSANIYRQIAQEPEKYLSGLKERVYFIGFNALSKAEEKIMKFLVNSGVGQVIWDLDDYYVKSDIMEAGRFIRRFQSWSGANKIVSGDSLTRQPKEIRIYGSNSNVQQVSVASKLLEKAGANDVANTALVFADEKLLKPMLNVLPSQVERLNVAMGYPLNAASSFSFFEDIVQVQVNIDRHRNKGFVYHKDFTQITQHEIFQLYAKSKGVNVSGIQKKITEQNYAYLPFELVEKEFYGQSHELSFLFTKAENVTVFLEQLVAVFSEVYELVSDQVIERESVGALLESLEKLMMVQGKYKRIEKITTFNQLVKQLLRGLKVSFLGEPLMGLQILGLLETRALDFKRVILLSCNEDVLPKKVFSNSLIPFDLRMYLGLPTKDDQEAIFAYYFYRLIQRAESVDLVYNAGEADGLQSNEISRYLLQIEEELPSDLITVKRIDPKVHSQENKETLKDDRDTTKLKERLVTWFEKGVSASGINQFNTCPKNFVYTQLMGLSQNEDVEEDIELSTYGTIVHEVLENLYASAGDFIGVREVDAMLGAFEKELNGSFDQRFPGGNYKTGKNLLLYETAVHTVRKYLKSEKKYIQDCGAIKILGLEVKKEKTIRLQTSIGEIKLKIKGLVDRVDQVGNKVRIIDYKTGRVDKLNFKGDWSRVSSYQLQLMTYLYLFDTDLEVTSGMISFKQLSLGFQEFSYADQSVFSSDWKREVFDPAFESFLGNFVEEVIGSDFKHNPKSDYCILC